MKKNLVTNKLYKIVILLLIPLILFGIYKHGFIPYKKGYITLIESFKPLVLILISLVAGVLANIFILKKRKKSIKENLLNNYEYYAEILLFSMILPIKSSPIIVFILTFFFFLLFNKLKLNKASILFCITYLTSVLFGLNIWQNKYEMQTVLNYSPLDLFLGFNEGGICSTSIILILLSLVILSFNKLYKKDISISATLTYLVLVTVPCMINSHYSNIFTDLFSNNVFFSFVFIAPILYCSSYTTKGQIFSGIMIGVLTYFITLIFPHLGVFISILIVNLINKIIDRYFIVMDKSA